MFIVVSFVKSTGKAIDTEANLSCGDFLFKKKLSSQYWQFFFLFGLDCQTLFEFSQILRQWCLFGFGDAFITC